jgi:hypothetical protein
MNRKWWPNYLIKELLASGAGLNGKFQLSIHGRNPHIDLQKQTTMLINR